MKLLRLKASNIFSLGNIDLDLRDRGLTLVTGWSYDDKNGNMAGKSSLASNAIMWCLYGKTVSGVRADAVINTSTNNTPSEASVWFEGIDGVEYKVRRSRNPNKLVLTSLVEDKLESIKFSMTKRKKLETQEIIDKVLGRDFLTFIQSDFFGQGRERSFLSLAGNEQRTVIEEILPLTSLEKWHTTAKDHIIAEQEKIDEVRMSLAITSTKLSALKTKDEEVQAQHTNWNTTKIRDVSTARAKLNAVQGVASNTKDIINNLMETLPSGVPAEETLDAQRLISTVLNDSLHSVKRQIENMKRLIKRYHDSEINTCIECGQKLPDDLIKLTDIQLNHYETHIKQLHKRKGDLEAKLYLSDSLIGIAKEVVGLEKQIKTQAEEATLIAYLKEKEMETSPFASLIKVTASQIEIENSLLMAQGERLKELLGRMNHYTFWSHAFGKDLKTLLFEQVCPYLEDKANQYLRELNNGQIKVKFSTVKEMKSGDTKDEFCVTASSDTGSTVFELFSGAEKQLTSFAVGMALSDLSSMQTSGASKFMILDEPFLYQSPENCENIVNFITQHLRGKATILLISNEDNLRNLIPNRVHVVKRNGVSSLE